MKTVDRNGWWEIKHNPVSKTGVFPYLGSSISDECEPNKIYKVYRSAETLRESVPTWDNPPKVMINDHEMVGAGFTKIDDRPIQGIIHNPVFEDDTLYADISIYSESLKELIENGKKELSLGYFCKFEKQPGVYDGEAYDYVQVDMIGNHIALVDAGRCGSDVKVFDRKCVMDSFDITPVGLKKECDSDTIESTETTETKDSEMADKREFIRKIMAIAAKANSDFEGGEEEKVETIAKLLEESEYAKSERGTANDESEEESEKKAEDKCGKDEESKEEEKKTEDSEKEEEVKDNEEEKEVKDESLSLLKKIADGIDTLLKKSADEKEEEAKDEDDSEKKSEDEDVESKDEDDKEEKEAGDGVLFTFGQDKATDGEDPAIKAYLA